MKMLVASETFIVKEAILNLFVKNFKEAKTNAIDSLNEIDREILSTYDIIFLQADLNKLDELEIVSTLKQMKHNIKIVILDPTKNEKLCIKVIKMKLDGYVTSLDHKDEFAYIAKKIIAGGKFYDSNIVQQVFLNSPNKLEHVLTSRESEVNKLICKGMSNKEIGNALNITEYTVKKHISSILDKLNVKNRKDIIIHFKDKESDDFI